PPARNLWHQKCEDAQRRQQGAGNSRSHDLIQRWHQLWSRTFWRCPVGLPGLRGTDAPKSRMTRLDEKVDALDKDAQRLRAARRRIERDQRDSSTKRD